MKKMSKITALMLALLLVVSMLMPAYASSVANVDIDMWNAWLEGVKAEFPNMSVEEQYSYLLQVDDSAKEALITSLNEEQYNALIAYMTSLREPYRPVSVPFTKAAPFMPAVNVNSIRRMMLYAAKDSGLLDNASIVTSKSLSTDGKTLRLENYVTGKTTVTTITTSTPVDIVLVLDQSGSMASDFGGNSRQYAMKNAVNSFIDEVANKYSDQCDNRMALVTFGSNASILQNWVNVDSAGKNTLKGKVSGLPTTPSGATNVAAGMETAANLMTRDYNYQGSNSNRQKVVIVFTDGVPTESSDFDTGVANAAITHAKNLKDIGVTVYSIGIFDGVARDQLYGDTGFDRNSNGSVGSDWSDFSVWMIGDIKTYDVPAGNRFLNYLSSNFIDATEIGIKNYSRTFIGIGYRGWEITKNFDRTNTGYYLAAANASGLNDIFQTISSNIQSGTASVQLNSNTVVKDVISDYFTLPTDANGTVITSGIKVYTALYKQDGTWGEDTPSALLPTVTGNTVTVTGFDFSKNYCSTDNGRQDGNNDAAGNFYGRKLIIEIPIEVKDGFLGGNSVPTNGSNSGVYSGNTLVEQFTQPTVDMPVNAPEVTVTDKNVYLLATPTQAELMTDATITIKDTFGNAVTNFDVNEAGYGLEPWQYEYVDLKVTKPEAITIPMTGDGSYTLSCSMVSKGAAENPIAATGKINVFKPVLTFKDTVEDYLSDIVDGTTITDVAGYHNANNYAGTAWVHPDSRTEAEDAEPAMLGMAPILGLTYTRTPDEITEAGIVQADEDILVNVTVMIGTTPVDAYVTFAHEDCNCTLDAGKTCGWDAATSEFIVHVKNIVADLEITKTGLDEHLWENYTDKESAIFKVVATDKQGVEQTFWISLADDQTVTIKDLKVNSTFTITEMNEWTWRYADQTEPYTGTITRDANGNGVSVTINNTHNKQSWLGGDNYTVNKFAPYTAE